MTRSHPPQFLARLRSNSPDPTVLALPLVAALFCLLRWHHLVALEPYWLYIAVLIGSGTIRVIYSAVWSIRSRGTRSGYIGIYMGVIAIVVYSTGWGPILSIGFLFGAAPPSSSSDQRRWCPAWSGRPSP